MWQSRYRSSPTRRSRRTIALPLSLVPELQERLSGMVPDQMVLPAARGGAPRTSWFHTWVWGPACKASGTGLRPRVHDLRHSHASWLLADRRMTMQVVQDRLGHESITTTIDTYGHLARESWAGAAQVADLALVQSLPLLSP